MRVLLLLIGVLLAACNPAGDIAHLRRIAAHDRAEITGVLATADGSVYTNLQHAPWGGDATLRLRQR